MGRIIALVRGDSLLGAEEVGLRANPSMGSTGEANDFIAVPTMEPAASKMPGCDEQNMGKVALGFAGPLSRIDDIGVRVSPSIGSTGEANDLIFDGLKMGIKLLQMPSLDGGGENKVVWMGCFESLWQTVEIGLNGSASLHSPGEPKCLICDGWTKAVVAVCMLDATDGSEGSASSPGFVSPPSNDKSGGKVRSSPGLPGEAKDCILIQGLVGGSGGRWLHSPGLRGEVCAKARPFVGSVGDANDLIFDV